MNMGSKFVLMVVFTANVCCEAFLMPSQHSSPMIVGGTKLPPKKLVGERYFFNFGKEEKAEEVKQEEVKEDTTSKKEEGDLDDKLENTVENIFSFFFGKPEEEPMGLKRFGKQRFPEQYPATIDEWAEPLEVDDAKVQKLRPMLKNTNLEERGLTLTYDANRDGWNPFKFHQLVDKKGPALVVCTTTGGLVCGGYNPKGWVGYGEARGSIAAFLFTYDNGKDQNPTKLRKVGGPALAQMDIPETGPQFSPDALIIPMSKDNPKLARSKLGSYYERFPDGTNSLFGPGKSSVQLKDLKVYHGVWEEGEYIPFTDAEPFALY